MAVSERPALRVVDEDGQVHEDCPGCQLREDEIKGLQRDIRGWAARYRELERDKEREAKNSPLWKEAYGHFCYWRELTGRTGCEWTPERFFLVEPFMRRKKHAPYIRRGIEGIVFDHFVSTRRNGTKLHHHSWETLFKSTGRFEEAVNAAPRKPQEADSADCAPPEATDATQMTLDPGKGGTA